MKFQLSIFATIAAIALSSGSYYLRHKLIRTYPWAHRHKHLLTVLSVVFVVLQITGPFLYRMNPLPVHRPLTLQWITYILLGVFACFFFFTVAQDLTTFLARRFFDVPADLNRRAFFGTSFFSLATAAVGSAQALSGPQVYEVPIYIDDLPTDLEGFRIVQISDLHIGPIIGKDYAQDVVNKTNALKPDLIALTGDFVDGEIESLREQVAPLAQLQALHGVYFTSGNHEYYWGGESWIEEFRKMGHLPLINTHRVIQVGASSIAIIGVPDQSPGRADPNHTANLGLALKGVPPQATKVLLAHQPVGYEEANERGVHLQLSGHTHAGQFFPWSVLVSFAYRYYKGLNRHKNLWLYVSRGTGFWGPPIRFAIPSEISLLILRKATPP